MKFSVILLANILLCGCSATNKDENICGVEECNNECVHYFLAHSTYYGEYCDEHTCNAEDCYSKKDIDSDFCSYHILIHQKEEEERIKLSESQIEQVRKIAEEYCDLIMEKHSNIKNIYIYNDEPETDSVYIKFKCNVSRDDSDINPATIYLTIDDNGRFKAETLKYDKSDK